MPVSSSFNLGHLAIGVDIGGTKLAASVVSAEGRIYHKVKLPVVKESAERSLQQIVEIVSESVAASSISWNEVAGIGFAIPGIYYPETGKAWAPNLWGWDMIPLREMLQSRFSVPLVIDSDRSACVVGEQWLGAARGLGDVIFLTVGTGIGAGILTGGTVPGSRWNRRSRRLVCRESSKGGDLQASGVLGGGSGRSGGSTQGCCRAGGR